jgi:hypothetical protein
MTMGHAIDAIGFWGRINAPVTATEIMMRQQEAKTLEQRMSRQHSHQTEKSISVLHGRAELLVQVSPTILERNVITMTTRWATTGTAVLVPRYGWDDMRTTVQAMLAIHKCPVGEQCYIDGPVIRWKSKHFWSLPLDHTGTTDTSDIPNVNLIPLGTPELMDIARVLQEMVPPKQTCPYQNGCFNDRL